MVVMHSAISFIDKLMATYLIFRVSLNIYPQISRMNLSIALHMYSIKNGDLCCIKPSMGPGLLYFTRLTLCISLVPIIELPKEIFGYSQQVGPCTLWLMVVVVCLMFLLSQGMCMLITVRGPFV